MAWKKLKKAGNQLLCALTNNREKLIWSWVALGIIVFSGMVVSSLLGRYASKEMRDSYVLFISITDIFASITLSGFFTVIFIQTSRGNGYLFPKINTYILKKSGFSVVFSLVTGVFLLIIHRTFLGYGLLLFSFFLPFFVCLQSWKYYIKGKGNFKIYSIIIAIKSLFFLAFFLFVIIIKPSNFYLLILSVLLTESIVNYLSFKYFLKNCPEKAVTQPVNETEWKSQGYKLTLFSIINVLAERTDLLLIGSLMPVGLPFIFSQTKAFFGLFTQLIDSSIEVILNKVYSDKKLSIGYFLKRFWILVLIPLLLFYPIKYPILLLYGKKNFEIYKWTQIYLFIIPLYFITVISYHFLLKHQLNNKVNSNKVIGVIFTLTLYFILIPKFGIFGAIIGQILGLSCQLALNLYSIRRLNDAQFSPQ